MHVVLVVFKEQGSFQLLFEHRDHAEKVYATLRSVREFAEIGASEFATQDWYTRKTVEVHDDFGTSATTDGEEIRTIILQDVSRHLEGASIHQLTNQRANAALQKKMAADPQLRLLAPNGPMPSLQGFNG